MQQTNLQTPVRFTGPLIIRCNRTRMIGLDACGYSVYCRPFGGWRKEVYSKTILDSDFDNPWSQIINALLPKEHFDLPLGMERYEKYKEWEKIADQLETELCWRFFPETQNRAKPTWLWLGLPKPVPQNSSVSIELSDTFCILIFQEKTSGKYQIFFPENPWFRHKFKNYREMELYYSSAQQVELELIWIATGE